MALVKQAPSRPDMLGAPVQPKKKRWPWILGGAVLLAVAISSADQSSTPTREVQPVSAPEMGEPDIADEPVGLEITAAMVVDVMGSNTVDEFCTNYFIVGNYDLAFAAFSQEYAQPSPSADEVFDELLNRC